MQVVKLPYMGKPTPGAKPWRASIESLDEEGEIHPDPLEQLISKVTRLAEMLGCSEAEAENLLFNRL